MYMTEQKVTFYQVVNLKQDFDQRLKVAFENLMIELYINFNKLLQRNDPCIHILYDQMFAFLQSLLGKLIQIHVIQNTVTLNEIDFLNPVNQLPDENLFIGFTAKIFLTKLENDGDICSQIFYKEVRAFYAAASSDMV